MIQRVETQRNVTGNIAANREVAANVMRIGINSGECSDSTANALAIRSGARRKKHFKKAKGNRFCDHCQRSGHTSDQCFKVIGYPDWYQGPEDNARPRRNVRVVANLASSEGTCNTPLDCVLGTQENTTAHPSSSSSMGRIDSNLVQVRAQEMMMLVKGQ